MKNPIRIVLESPSASGVLLILCSIVALVVANSPLSHAYFALLHADIGALSLEAWVNDALMALFFLVVGLEIKREMILGELSSWPKRILPGIAALAGMAVPAAIFLLFNSTGESAKGWAIPSATDIAFSLGVISLLGSRVPNSLKVFLAALAIMDDLGAVIVIGLFYTPTISLPDLGMAALVFVMLIGLNRMGIMRLSLYLVLGCVLWFFTYRSGVHATLAGVLLAITIPVGKATEGGSLPSRTPLFRLEKALVIPVGFIIVPIFAFVNAGVNFIGLDTKVLVAPMTLGVALGLAVGKTIGVFGIVTVLVKLKAAQLPYGANWKQMFGVAVLCGIGFTMSLFISLLAFDNDIFMNEAKIGILIGSCVAGIVGYLILRYSSSQRG